MVLVIKQYKYCTGQRSHAFRLALLSTFTSCPTISPKLMPQQPDKAHQNENSVHVVGAKKYHKFELAAQRNRAGQYTQSTFTTHPIHISHSLAYIPSTELYKSQSQISDVTRTNVMGTRMINRLILAPQHEAVYNLTSRHISISQYSYQCRELQTV